MLNKAYHKTRLTQIRNQNTQVMHKQKETEKEKKVTKSL